LKHLIAIEKALGRNRLSPMRWGPRTMDLDILLYGALIVQTLDLTLPHPRLHERLFALEPLVEIAPHIYHPLLKRSAQALLAEALAKNNTGETRQEALVPCALTKTRAPSNG